MNNAYSPPSSETILTRPPTTVVRQEVRFSRRMRFSLFVHGVFLPSVLICMSWSGVRMADQPWQSGELVDYVAMLLLPEAWLPFLPGILYAAIALGGYTFKPALAQQAWVRFGIYTGIILALHFFILLSIISEMAIPIFTLIVWPAWYGALWLVKYFWRRQLTITHILVLTTIVALLCALVWQTGVAGLMWAWTVVAAVVIAAPG